MIGFRGEASTEILLSKADQLLRPGGSLVVVGSTRNPWSKFKNAERYIEMLHNQNLFTNFQIDDLSLIDQNNPISSHVFSLSTFNTATVPNETFLINKLSQ